MPSVYKYDEEIKREKQGTDQCTAHCILSIYKKLYLFYVLGNFWSCTERGGFGNQVDEKGGMET